MAAHNAEEALYTRDWVLANADLLARYGLTGAARAWASPGFRFSLLGLTLLLLALAVLAARAPRRGGAIYLFLGILAVFAANAVFPHIAVAVALRAYVPGVATATALVLPVATWVYVSMLRDGHATRRGTVIAATVGVALYAAVIGLVAGGWVAR
jgi:hypothetical protein